MATKEPKPIIPVKPIDEIETIWLNKWQMDASNIWIPRYPQIIPMSIANNCRPQ